MDLEKRQEIEYRIVKQIIKSGIEAGYSVSVHNGEEFVIAKSKDVNAIMSQMFSVDEEHLMFYNEEKKKVGFVFLVYGNDGYDVINDYSYSLENIMTKANDLADYLSAK